MYILTRELDDGKLTDRERTMTFTCFVVFDMMNALACRSQRRSIMELAPNKPLYIAIGLSLLGQGKNVVFNVRFFVNVRWLKNIFLFITLVMLTLFI